MAKSVIVTGGGRGIGRACAVGAARAGYDVVINYATNDKAAASTCAAIEAEGRRALAIKGDVAREIDVAQLFERSLAAFGTIDALINNAGIITAYGRVEDLPIEAARRAFEVNVLGAFLCARAAISHMSRRNGGKGGSIVNISSRAATMGMPGEYVCYAATKGAINTMTQGLALELAGEGIRVNAVSPGLIATEIQDPARLARVAPSVPIGRAGTPEEVAGAVLWLLSDAASYVTGANISVTGGR